MKHLPNVLTILRLVLSVLMFLALAEIGEGRPLPTALVADLARFSVGAFVIASITDFFDGWLARRWGVTSVLGAILDPIADKVLVCGAILGLLSVHAPGVLIAGGVILFREFAVSALREVLAPRGVKLPVTFLAKTKTTLQLVALAALMALIFWPVWGLPAPDAQLEKAYEAAEALFAVAAAVTLWTGFEYGRAALKALKQP